MLRQSEMRMEVLENESKLNPKIYNLSIQMKCLAERSIFSGQHLLSMIVLINLIFLELCSEIDEARLKILVRKS